MRKLIFGILIFLSLTVLVVRYSSKIGEILFNIKEKGGISVLSAPDSASVFLDGKQVGKTPYEDKNLEVKQYLIKLEKEGASWQGNVKLTPQTMAIINRDLAKEQASSSGEILTLNKGRGITVISNPADSQVEVDGKQ